jgi:Kef-type K+ transport system membrane component KefB
VVHLSLPLDRPVFIFTLVLLIILLVPLLLRKVRVPTLIGLILAGIVVGPRGFNLLQRDASIVLFGTVGLLYIMFLAGLEMDLVDFKRTKGRALVFGAFTFLIPQTLGTIVGVYVLGFSLLSSILLASMFASHTLLAYPIVSRLGISRSEVVAVTVGGTMITDTAALLLLAVIAGSYQGELSGLFWLRLLILSTALVLTVLFLFPRIATWFFKYGQMDGALQYVFIMAVVFAAALLAELAGLDAIIGAFLAGLAMNRLVPHTSPLMNRIEFVGNALFIPFFLISVGMLVDVRLLFQGPEALFVAAVMIVVASGCKWLAALATQKVLGYSATERSLIFGLSNAQAAATLAAVLIGYNIGLLNEFVLNGSILMILVTCLMSTLTVENAGRRLALTEGPPVPAGERSPVAVGGPPQAIVIPERILVPIASEATIEPLIDLALMIKNPLSAEPIYPLVVVKEDNQARKRLQDGHRILEQAVKYAASTESVAQVVSRVDPHVASGIVRAVKELGITMVVLDWNGQARARERIFGTLLDTLLTHVREMVVVSRIRHPLNVTREMLVVVPPYAELETGFDQWLRTVQALSRQAGARLIFLGSDATLHSIASSIEKGRPAVETSYRTLNDWEHLPKLLSQLKWLDLLVIVMARWGTVSYQKQLDAIPAKVGIECPGASFVFIYPEQNVVQRNGKVHTLDTFNEALLKPVKA